MTADELDQYLLDHKQEILDFQHSEMWKLWLEFAKYSKEAYDHNLKWAGTQEQREHARSCYIAFHQFEQIPFAIVRKVEMLSQTEVPKNNS